PHDLYAPWRQYGHPPFCLTVSMTHPHDPSTMPEPSWDLYADEEIPMPPPHANQAALDPHSQRLLKVDDLWDKPMPTDKIRDARRAYFGACSYIDLNVGKLMRTPDEVGPAADNIVVLPGHPGDLLGEKSRWSKMHWLALPAPVPTVGSTPGQVKPCR
ncbi:choline-sulfatase, partial [Pseudomonas syringae]